jgi:hypothetical protein
MVMAGGVSAGKGRKAPFRVKVMDMKLYLGKPGGAGEGYRYSSPSNRAISSSEKPK